MKACVTTLIVSAIWLFPLPANAQSRCDDEYDTAAIVSCLQLDFEAEDRRLNDRYRRLAAMMRASDVSAASDATPAIGEQRLREAQRAWIRFRDAECRLTGHAMIGGSQAAILEAGCRTARTRERVGQLDNLLVLFDVHGGR